MPLLEAVVEEVRGGGGSMRGQDRLDIRESSWLPCRNSERHLLSEYENGDYESEGCKLSKIAD